MELIQNLLNILAWLCTLAILPFSAYLFLLAIAGTRKTKLQKEKANPASTKIHIVVPAYQNDEVLIHTCTKNLKSLSSTQINFSYWILGDKLQDNTRQILLEKPVKLVDINLEKSTKSRAINQWLEKEGNELNGFVFLLDVDNLIALDGLENLINNLDENSDNWYQLNRIAANEEADISELDAWSEAVNNFIFRRGAQNLGIQPALIGSGMLAPLKSFSRLHRSIDVTGGFDKWLEHYVIQSQVKIIYREDIKILDQKIADLSALKTQRTRWVAAQYSAAKQLFPVFLSCLMRLKIKHALKYFQLYLPPRVLHLLLSTCLLLTGFLSSRLLALNAINFGMLIIALYLASPPGKRIKIPLLFAKHALQIVRSYLGMGKDFSSANKEFLVTQHKKPNE
ncbi:MAG: glycosyltransferase [Luteibaculum sp.]